MRSSTIDRSGFWPWVLQRASGAALLVFMTYHLWVQHIKQVGQPITFSLEVQRFLSALYRTVDVALLGVVIFHGLNGVRNVAIDWGADRGTLNLVTLICWLVGLALFGWGLHALWPFMTGHPLFTLHV